MLVGLLDADLINNGTKHPNLALMKLSGYHKEQGNTTRLVDSYADIEQYDKVYVAKVFTTTPTPTGLEDLPNVEYGGTGFFFDQAPDLPYEVEHHMPDYHLYDDYVATQIERGLKQTRFGDYLNFSIGFATRGCFRKCPFCVNQKYDCAFRHSPVSEFFDPSRRNIYLWDDNVFAYPGWRDVFEELDETGRRFAFRQGLDIRLLTDEKAKVLSSSRYLGDSVFAFDNWKDRDLISEKLKLWREWSDRPTKLYILCGYESQDLNDIIGIFERISVLSQHRCIPYLMRYKDYENSEFRGMYITLARWCNQPSMFKMTTFRQFCVDVKSNGVGTSTWRYMTEFESKYPEVARRYFDKHFYA